MTNRAKAKGDRAELEVQGILRDLLGVPARRKLGAGRLDDMGDIDGVPDTVISVANYKDIARAITDKLPDVEAQVERAEASFGAMFVRRPKGKYVVCMTPEMFAALWREADPRQTIHKQSPCPHCGGEDTHGHHGTEFPGDCSYTPRPDPSQATA